jgi:hypothetical protein
MLYGGTVGGIPVANYTPTLSFNWGLFSYRGMLGAEKFMVVQYYVEPAP